MQIPFKGTETKEINDIRYPHVFAVQGYSYIFTIRPSCPFWRLSLRFTTDPKGQTSNSRNFRYNDPQIKHLEVCVGVRDSEWHSPNILKLQEYHISDTHSVYYTSEQYYENSEVTVSVAQAGEGFLKIILTSENIQFENVIDIKFSRVFELYGWADFLAFDIICNVKMELTPLRIELPPVRALSEQETWLDVGKRSVFFGGNNSGKTSVLFAACNAFYSQLIYSIDYLGLNRIHSVTSYDFQLEAQHEQNRKQKQRQNRRKRVENDDPNVPFDWMEELALQDDETRSKILEWINTHFEGWIFQEIKTGKFVTGIRPVVNGLEPVNQGSGAKAVLPIVMQLYNPEITILAIDEPEMGLEPRMQKTLMTAIKNASEGTNGFPVTRILLATHSHLFLDRSQPDNNFNVCKNKGQVIIERIHTTVELQQAAYNMLGSSPSDLFFPGNIVIVEGLSDFIFLDAIYKIGISTGKFINNVTFHYLDGYEKLSHAQEAIVQMLKTQSYSPVYRNRICGIFDQPFKNSALLDAIREFCSDIEKNRFILLEKPAIEFYYPVDAVNEIFGTTLDITEYSNEVMKFTNSISKKHPYQGIILNQKLTKVEFANLVVQKMNATGIEQIDFSIMNLLTKADRLAFN